MKIEMNKAISFALVMILCTIAMPALFTNTVSAAPGDRPLHGFVMYENDTLVGAGATVRGFNGTVLYDTATTDAESFYTIQNGVAPVDGDTVTITATITVGSVVYTGSAILTLSVGQTFIFQNITVSAVTVSSFNATFFAVDVNGTGVANVNVSVLSALGVYHNVTTNSTGYAVVAGLIVGAYTYTVSVNASNVLLGLHNRTGSLNIVDRDVPIRIDLSVLDNSNSLSVLGISVSKYCLLIIVVVLAIGLGYLFVRNMSKHSKKGDGF